MFGFFSARARKRQIAIDIDLEAGVLERCPVCHDIADKQRDDLLPAAEALARRLLARGDARVTAFRHDPDALLRLLREVRRDFEYLCACERL